MPEATLPAEGRQLMTPAGLLAWGSSSGPPSRLSGGMMGRRPPTQLRGSAGFEPASRAPGATQNLRAARFAVNPDSSWGSVLIWVLNHLTHNACVCTISV